MVGLPQSFCTPQKKNPSGSKHQMSVPRILVFLAFPIVCVSLGSYNCSVGVGKKLFILTGITMLSFSILFVVCSSLNTFILFFETERENVCVVIYQWKNPIHQLKHATAQSPNDFSSRFRCF